MAIMKRKENVLARRLYSFCAIVLMNAAVAIAVETNVYLFDRTFKPTTNRVDSATLFNIIKGVELLTNQVVGKFSIITNEASSTEFEGVSWGQSSFSRVWSNVLSGSAGYPIAIANYDEIFDDPGWIKGKKTSYDRYGTYMWILQNSLDFKTSEGIFYTNNGYVFLIEKVHVGTLGDLPANTNVHIRFPCLNESVTNHPDYYYLKYNEGLLIPGDPVITGEVIGVYMSSNMPGATPEEVKYKFDTNAYYQLSPVLGTLTDMDTTNPSNVVEDASIIDSTFEKLYLCEGSNAAASMSVELTWNTNLLGSDIKWRIERLTGELADQEWSIASGDFMTNPFTTTWTNASGAEREFVLWAWYDMNADGIRDSIEPHRMIHVFVLKMDLDIWNGGSDLDNGENPPSQGTQVPEGSEVSTGAYILVNWDDDDGDGSLNQNTDGWATDPTPDLNDANVPDEDNLAKLKPSVEPLLDTGTVELEVSGADAGRIKLWTQNTKGTPVTLTSNKKTWNLANSTEKADFQNFMSDGYWIEGTDAGTTERGVTFTLRYKDTGGNEVCSDANKATVVMLNLGDAPYRVNTILGWDWVSERGHAAIIARFTGTCTRESLTNSANYEVIEMQSSAPGTAALTSFTMQSADYWGIFTNPNITYLDRLKILGVARWILGHAAQIGYPLSNGKLVRPTDWNRRLSGLDGLRCDGLVEVAYEINGIDTWGKIVSGATHYDITASDAFFQEHNETSWYVSDWPRYIFPATQCGRAGVWLGNTYVGIYWNTQMQAQNLFQPALP